jgi:ABC-type methionine transport system permease subunit
MGYSFMFSSGSWGDKGCLWFKSNWPMSWRFLNFLVMCTSYLHCKASLLLVVGFFLCVVSVFYSRLQFFFLSVLDSVLLAIQYFLNISCSFAFATLLVWLTPWF